MDFSVAMGMPVSLADVRSIHTCFILFIHSFGVFFLFFLSLVRSFVLSFIHLPNALHDDLKLQSACGVHVCMIHMLSKKLNMSLV